MKSLITPIKIVPGQGAEPLGKAQKAFNRLLQQIEKKRAKLAAWEAIAPPFQRQYTAEMQPLLQAARALKVASARALDQIGTGKGLNKREKRLVSMLIVDLAGDLLVDAEDAEIKALYNKHTGSNFDADQAVMLDGLRGVVEAGLGIDLGDDVDFSSPEDVMARIRERVEERERLAAGRARQPGRKKSAQALDREARQAADEQGASQSIREIYRKLASALHPDREADPVERARKTVLMQRANQAYEKGNLLLLLELQIELEHIDQAGIHGLGEARLSQYNRMLKEQLAELDTEAQRVEGEFRLRFGISPHGTISPATLLRGLAEQIAMVVIEVREMRDDLAAFQDVQATRAWLKAMPERPWMDLDQIPF